MERLQFNLASRRVWRYSDTTNPQSTDLDTRYSSVQQVITFPWINLSIREFLYNSADEKFDSTMKVNAVVEHTGDVLYVPPGLFKSVCSFDIAAFPFVGVVKILSLP